MPEGERVRFVAALSLSIFLSTFCCLAGEEGAQPVPAADEAAEREELLRRIRCHDQLIEQLERRLDEEDSLIPYTNIHMSPTLRQWRDFFRNRMREGQCR